MNVIKSIMVSTSIDEVSVLVPCVGVPYVLVPCVGVPRVLVRPFHADRRTYHGTHPNIITIVCYMTCKGVYRNNECPEIVALQYRNSLI